MTRRSERYAGDDQVRAGPHAPACSVGYDAFDTLVLIEWDHLVRLAVLLIGDGPTAYRVVEVAFVNLGRCWPERQQPDGDHRSEIRRAVYSGLRLEALKANRGQRRGSLHEAVARQHELSDDDHNGADEICDGEDVHPIDDESDRLLGERIRMALTAAARQIDVAPAPLAEIRRAAGRTAVPTAYPQPVTVPAGST